ncbi:MAG: tetratricopeptide repeat protein [Rhodospirillaceae bacterium]|nr:tetratricopeptide repeat protein [Rhodospirillaceae bacterium]
MARTIRTCREFLVCVWLGGALAIALWFAGFGASAQFVAARDRHDGGYPPPSTSWGAYLSALHAARQKDSPRASAYFVTVTPLIQKHETLLMRALRAHILAGRMRRALDLSRRIVVLAPDHSMSRLMLALDAVNRKNYTAARSHLDRVSGEAVNRLLLPMLRAWIVLGLHNDPDLALNELIDLRNEPRFRLFLLMHTAFLLDVGGKRERAAKAYENVASAAPAASLRLTETSSNFKARTGDRVGAIRDVDRYLASNPNFTVIQVLRDRYQSGDKIGPLIGSPADGVAEVLLNVASALKDADRAADALPFARLAVWMRSQDSSSIFLLGSVLERDSRYREAISAFKRLRPTANYNWEARKSAVVAMVSLEDFKPALATLENMAVEKPDRYDALWLLGNVYRNRSKFELAVEAYDRAVGRIPKINRRHWNLLYVRGIALERSKQWKRAEADFLRALRLNPGQADVLNYLAYSWVERGENLERARKMLAAAGGKRPSDGYIIDSVGWVEYRLGNFEAAVRHLERATELSPHDPTINDHLGDAYWRVGRRHEARFQWRRALSLNPEKADRPNIEQKLREGMPPFKPINQ